MCTVPRNRRFPMVALVLSLGALLLSSRNRLTSLGYLLGEVFLYVVFVHCVEVPFDFALSLIDTLAR